MKDEEASFIFKLSKYGNYDIRVRGDFTQPTNPTVQDITRFVNKVCEILEPLDRREKNG